MRLSFYKFLVIGACLFSLSGCMGLVAGTAAGVGAKTVAKDKTLADSTSDARIELEVSNLWFKHNVDLFNALSVTSEEGRVLLTGTVQKHEWKTEAESLARKVEGVRKILNEIKIGPDNGVKGAFSDQWITAQLRTKLTLDDTVVSINYTIDTVDGRVYLSGIAQNPEEMERAVHLARSIENVREVVSNVRMRGDLQSHVGLQNEKGRV